MRKQRTFYATKTNEGYESALEKANEWIAEINIPFDVTHVDITLKRRNSWDDYHAVVKVNFK